VRRFTLPEDLAALDELLLKGDARPTTRPIMTIALVLSNPPSAGRLEAAFARAVERVPRMRQRVARSAWIGGSSGWVTDEDFDLDYHLRRIGAPGDGSLEDALAWASAGATAPMDPARPLWDSVVVEGLQDNRAVVLIRAHHAIADGVRAVQMMGALLDLEPRPAAAIQEAGMPSTTTELPLHAAQMLRAAERFWVGTPQRWPATLRSGFAASRRPVASITNATAYVRSVLRTVNRGDAEPSPLLARRSTARRFATLEIPLDPLKAAAKAHGATVNDVYLSSLLGGLQRYHEAFGCDLGEIAVAVPIDVAADAREAGNHISAAVIPGPASQTDPVERLRAVRALMLSRRDEPGLRALARLAPTFRQLPARVATTAMGLHARRVDLQASNLIGPSFPLYLAAERIERMYAFGPLPGVPAMAVLVSYDGLCTIGLTLDPAAVTDIALLVGCIKDAFDELLTSSADDG
jgi:diacylglycerol O-acyltransferase